jgi:hypothetical protein
MAATDPTPDDRRALPPGDSPSHGQPFRLTGSIDALVLCVFTWILAFRMVDFPGPYRELMRPEIRSHLPAWLPIPAPGVALIDDPVYALLAGLAVGLSLAYAALSLALPHGTLRRWTKALCFAGCLFALLVVPTALDIALTSWHGRGWHGHDGGVVQTDLATDFVLQGSNPYEKDYTGTDLARAASASYWHHHGGNPALYHFPYLPLSFLLPIPLRPLLRALFGYYDARMLYLLCFAGAIACSAALRGRHRAALAASVAFCPLLVPFLIEGRNEVLVLLPLLAMALFLQREQPRAAMLMWGIACSTKQFAWVFAPLLLAWFLGRARAGGRPPWRALRPLWWAALPVVVLVGPFVAWDAGAFWEDAVQFMSGSTGHPYPFGGTPGLGFANLLLYFGRVHSLQQAYSFWPWQLLFGAPLLLVLGWSLLRKPDWRVVVGGGALLGAAFLFGSRVLHVNYLGLFWPLWAAAVASEPSRTATPSDAPV